MKLQKFIEKNNKQKSIMIFTIACILLITGVFLYKTFASFQLIKNEDLINGSIEDPGDIYFAFYKDNKIQKEMPTKEQGYVLDEENSYCGVTGGKESDIKVHVTEDNMIHVSGVTTSRTKCNLYFVKGIYLLGKGVPVVTSGEGLYEVKHDGITGTINDTGFQQTEYRYAGSNPDNYIKFNDEDWRIIGLVNVMTDENNTVEQRVKIVRNLPIEELPWDYNCTTLNLNNCTTTGNWSDSVLQNILNEKYLQPNIVNYYYRKYSDNAVYSNELDLKKIYLKDNYNFMIDTVFWNIGDLDRNNQNKDNLYSLERKGNETWKGKIALLLPSDAAYTFYENTFLKLDYYYWSLRVAEYDHTQVITFINHSVLKLHFNADTVYYRHNVFPSLYLKPTVTIMSGTGTSDDAFQLIQILK